MYGWMDRWIDARSPKSESAQLLEPLIQVLVPGPRYCKNIVTTCFGVQRERESEERERKRERESERD